ncbi:MAG: hypothetical protein ACK4OO_06385, partial [bacterium]
MLIRKRNLVPNIIPESVDSFREPLEIPEIPEIPESSEVPQVSEIPMIPEISGFEAIPESPDISDIVESPDLSVDGWVPSVPVSAAQGLRLPTPPKRDYNQFSPPFALPDDLRQEIYPETESPLPGEWVLSYAPPKPEPINWIGFSSSVQTPPASQPTITTTTTPTPNTYPHVIQLALQAPISKGNLNWQQLLSAANTQYETNLNREVIDVLQSFDQGIQSLLNNLENINGGTQNT